MESVVQNQPEVQLEESKKEIEYLACEKWWVFLTLTWVGGFLGAFTYSIRGGVFCNAQTANFVLLSMAVGSGQWGHALYYFVPMIAYFIGIVISETVAKPIKKLQLIRWDTLLVLIEMMFVLLLGFIPESAPYQISQVMVNFICAMQYNTFRQAEGMPVATTFCTNHFRQVGVAFTKAVKHRDPVWAGKMWRHLSLILIFTFGGVISTMLCHRFLGRAVWGAMFPLVVVFCYLLDADLKREKGLLSRVPRGH